MNARREHVPSDAERIAGLEEEVAWLRGELRLDQEAARIGKLMSGLRITPAQALILLALFDAHGRVLPRARLQAIACGADLDGPDNVLKAQIWHIRHRAGPDLVRTVAGLGYAITPAGADHVREALGE